MTDLQFGIILSALAVIQTLATFILKSVLQNTIRFEFKKREQAAMVASLFAEWMDRPKEQKDLNRLTWEATLWLPDDIAQEVNKRLRNAPGAKDLKEILVDIKGLIHGRKSKMNPMDIVHYPKQ
jgi:hypothetical protein